MHAHAPLHFPQVSFPMSTPTPTPTPTPAPIRLTLAHSPDADDLVMWWPLTGLHHANGSPFSGADGKPALDTHGITFELIAADIHTLNTRAANQHDLDITAISAMTYPLVKDHYRITACGGSFGRGYGPKVVVKKDSSIMCDGCLRGQKPTIAVPGDKTTAFGVLAMVLDGPFEHVIMPFEQIAPAVAAGEVGAGLLIHEAQLLYQSLGLREVIDLGIWWEKQTSLPLPLGLNVIHRKLDKTYGQGTSETVAQLLSQSVRYARAHPAVCQRLLLDRVGDRPEWADQTLVTRYLDMYVNDLTEDMGSQGRDALGRLFAEAASRNLCSEPGPIDILS